MGSAQAPRTHAGRGDPGPVGGVGLLRWELLPVPAEAEEAGSWGLGKGLIMAALPLAHHLTMTPCFYGISGFFCRLIQLWSFLLLSLQAVFSQPTAVPSLGPHCKPHFPAPNPLLQQVTRDSGMCRAVV